MQNLGAVLMYHHVATQQKPVKNSRLRDTSQLLCDLHVSGTSGYHTLALCHAIHIRLSLLFIFHQDTGQSQGARLVVPSLCAPPSKKQSGERSRIS